jgi:hypothetical protein
VHLQQLPDTFCWTRFGFEAGQSPSSIVARKERERESNGGLFLWGIGNAVAAAVSQLLRASPDPAVLFSPIRSRPRTVDVTPEAVVAWTQARGLDGRSFELPPSSMVTSRYPRKGKKGHYALVCYSADPLVAGAPGIEVSFSCLANLISGKPLAASQVTAVVRRRPVHYDPGPHYAVAMKARLVRPYFLWLTGPVAISNWGL